MEIGKKLREAREEKGLTIDQLQERTKIRKKYLVAIEKDNYDPIPGNVYVKAFIKGYAEEVDLDGSKLVQEYQRWIEEQENERIENEEPEEDKSTLGAKMNILLNNKLFRIILIIVLLAVIGFAAYTYLWKNNSANTVQAPARNNVENVQSNQLIENENNSIMVSENEADRSDNNTRKSDNKTKEISLNNTDNNKTTVQGINKPDSKSDKNDINYNENEEINNQNKQLNNTNSSPEQDGEDKLENNKLEQTSNKQNKQIKEKIIKIIAADRSWLQLSIDSNNAFQGFIDKGEVKKYTGSNIISVKIGNGSAVKVQVGEKVYGPWGGTGEVIKREISLK